MASKEIPSLLHCTKCHQELSIDSKILPCLHSLCLSCFISEAAEEDQCPECQESPTVESTNLPSYLAKLTSQRRLELAGWNCYWCWEEGIKSPGRNWCRVCMVLMCNNCSRCHKKPTKNMNKMMRVRAEKEMEWDFCTLHQKYQKLYCKSCNVCVCDKCYPNHKADTTKCSFPPLSVAEEAEKQKLNVPSIAKDMEYHTKTLKRLIKKTDSYVKKLNADCEFECHLLQDKFEEMKQEAERRTNSMCDELKRLTSEMVGKWQKLIAENERILKRLEIWRLNFDHLMSDAQKDSDVVCGLRMLELKASSRLQKADAPDDKYHFRVISFDWWLELCEVLKSQEIGSVSLFVEKRKVVSVSLYDETQSIGSVFKGVRKLSDSKIITAIKEWDLPGLYLVIRSILVNEKDNHIFLGCHNKSIMEYDEDGRLVDECILEDGTYSPKDMCWVSPEIFVVVASRKQQTKLFFVERKINSPFLEVITNIKTGHNFRSLCRIGETLFICDNHLQIYSATKEGENIKKINKGEIGGWEWPLIRADSMNGVLWVNKKGFRSELLRLSRNGVKLKTEYVVKEITDFFVNESGEFYFCTLKGIYSFPPKRRMFKFEKKSEIPPRIFASKQKVFVQLGFDGVKMIKIFEISD